MNVRVTALATVLAVLVAACGGGTSSPGPAPAASSATAAATATAAPTLAPVTLKMGQVGGISDAAIYIALAKGYFREQAITIESSSFTSAALMVAPLGTGELQVGGGAAGAGLFNAIDRGVGIRIVADKGNLNPGHGYEATVVRTELAGTIKGPADLKGRTVAISALNITPEVTLAAYLKQGGLTMDDIKLVTVAHPDMLLALKNGSIDVGLPIEPSLSRILEAGVAKVLTYNDKVTPRHQTAVMLFGEKFLQQRDVAVRFMKAYLQGARFYNDAFVKKDGAKRAEAITILAAATKLDAKLFETMVMPGIDPSGKVNIESLGEIQDYFVKKGSQPKAIDMTKAVDLSFAAEAERQLGAYR